MGKLRSIGIGVAVLGLFPAAASAQSVGGGQSVTDRARPEYDAVGSRLGLFTIYPSVTVTGLVTDNYLATDTNRRSDAFLLVQPEIVARTDQARVRTQTRAFVTQGLHARFNGDNTTQFGLSTSGAFDPTHDTQLRADAGIARYTESRSSLGAFQGSAEPVVFETYHGGVGASHSFNDLTIGANAAVDYRNFHDTEFPGGSPIDQDYRDVRQISAGGDAQYSLRNGIGLIVSGQYSTEHYTNRVSAFNVLDLDRDSSGFNVLGGVTLELSRLIFGRFQIGYLNRRYRDSRLDDVGGLSYNADILWNVTTLTSLRFRASRSIEDTSSQFIAGNTRSDFHVFADHELYRYVIVSGDVGYARFRPNGIGVGGDEYTVGAGARYLINRRLSVSGNLRYSQRTSDSEFLRYHATSAAVSLRVQL